MILFRDHSSILSRKRVGGLFLFLLLLIGLCIVQKDRILSTVLPQPLFVQAPGMFQEGPASVLLSTPVSGDIFYTTDGSEPSVDSLRYQEPIHAEKPFVLKAAIFQNGKQITRTQTHDIFVGVNHTVPVLSLITEPKNLWDEETGIYVEGKHLNFRQSGEDWERPAELRFYSPNGVREFTQPVAIRLHGNHMRSMPQKSFRIYATDDEGRTKTLKYPLFGPEGNREYETFVLRNGGGDAQRSMLRDPLASQLALEGSSLTALRSRPVVLYLNGEYWGLYFMTERFDDIYFAQKLQVKRQALSVIEVPLDISEKRGQAIAETKGSEDDAKLYNKLLADVRSCGNCDHVARLHGYADIKNLVDYFLFELFFSNIDWPFNNTKIWRYDSTIQSPEAFVLPHLDGRFRWLFYDLDATAGAGSTEESILSSAQGDTYTKLVDDHFPFRNIFYTPSFRRLYLARMEELLKTTLSAQHMESTVDELAAEIRPEMPRHIERWGSIPSQSGYSVVSSMEEWERHVELLKLFVRNRPAGFAQRTENFFRNSTQ